MKTQNNTNLEIINSSSFQKELIGCKEILLLSQLSIKYPTLYIVGYFSNDGKKLKSVNAYENLDKAVYYSNQRNGTAFNNDNVLG